MIANLVDFIIYSGLAVRVYSFRTFAWVEVGRFRSDRGRARVQPRVGVGQTRYGARLHFKKCLADLIGSQF